MTTYEQHVMRWLTKCFRTLFDFQGRRLTNVGDPINNQDVVTNAYLETRLAELKQEILDEVS